MGVLEWTEFEFSFCTQAWFGKIWFGKNFVYFLNPILKNKLS